MKQATPTPIAIDIKQADASIYRNLSEVEVGWLGTGRPSVSEASVVRWPAGVPPVARRPAGVPARAGGRMLWTRLARQGGRCQAAGRRQGRPGGSRVVRDVSYAGCRAAMCRPSGLGVAQKPEGRSRLAELVQGQDTRVLDNVTGALSGGRERALIDSGKGSSPVDLGLEFEPGAFRVFDRLPGRGTPAASTPRGRHPRHRAARSRSPRQE